MRKDLEELARKHQDCRIYIEFAGANIELFHNWLVKDIEKLLKSNITTKSVEEK